MSERQRGNRAIRMLARVGPGPRLRYEARVAALARPWRARGSTLRECCERLNAAGVRTWRGREWKPSNLHHVL